MFTRTLLPGPGLRANQRPRVSERASNMAAVESGDSEQLEERASEGGGVGDEQRLRETLEACGETAARLKAENILIITRRVHLKLVQRNV